MSRSKHDPPFVVGKRCGENTYHVTGPFSTEFVEPSVLVDAAPELAAALRELLDVSCTFNPTDLSPWKAARKRAKAVLERVGY